LGFLAPGTRFAIQTRGDHTFIDPASYARYDTVADVVTAVDPTAAVQLYRRLQPLLETAYGELGHPRQTFDGTLRRACAHLFATRGVEGDVEARQLAIPYAFSDSRLEALSPAQKHFLRMGPRNVERVEATLRAVVAALDQPATP